MKINSWVWFPFSVALVAGADEIYVGWGERVAVDVAEGISVTQTDPVTASAAGTLHKTGAGTWTLPKSSVVQEEDLALKVHAGRVVLAAALETPPPAAEAPLDVLGKAALWLTTAKNLVVSNGADGVVYVPEWSDARESSATAARTRCWAKAGWSSKETAKALYGVPPALVTDAFGFPGVYFGGYGSAQCMFFQSPAGGNRDLTGISHTFVVTGIDKTYGYTLGANSGTPDFHIGDYGLTTTLSGGFWNTYGVDARAMHAGARTWLDGVCVDGFSRKPSRGVQLIETFVPGGLAHAENFFNDRYIADRAGGDYLYEAVVFTNQLTEAERLRVESYLLDTWNLRKGKAAVQARTAPGAEVKHVVASGLAENNRVPLAGDGVAVKSGSGAARFEAPSGAAYNGRVRVEDGLAALAVPAAVDVAAGEAVTVIEGKVGDVVAAPVAAPAAGTVVKRGDGTVRLQGLPADAQALVVEAGAVVLAPAAAPRLQPGGAVCATIPNPSFEEGREANSGMVYFVGQTRNGWTAAETESAWTTTDGNRTAFFYNYKPFDGGMHGKWPCAYDAPDGDIALAIKGDCQAWTTVSVPVAGRYELTFWTSARYPDGGNVNTFEILVGPDTAHLAPVGVVRQPKAPYTRRVLRTPALAAGDHVLMIRSIPSNIDGCTLFDDFRMELLTESDPSVWEVPNGDFEVSADLQSGTFRRTNTARGWTFDEQGSWPDGTYPCVGLAGAGMQVASGAPLHMVGESAHGQNALALLSTGGVARTTFTPPAGTYAVRLNARRWSGLWNQRVDLRGFGSVEVRVSVGGRAAVPLGTVWPASWILRTCLPTRTFTVADGEAVTLELRNTVHNGGTVVDDVVLLRDANLLLDGGFEAGSHWTLAHNRNDAELKNSAADLQDATTEFNAYHFPGGTVDGRMRALLTDRGCISQSVTFPAAGAYRLRCSTLSRRPQVYSGEYGDNPLAFWLARDGMTNVFGTTTVPMTNWVERTFLFHVPAAGDYVFGIQGLTDGVSARDRTSFVDAVSICRADATVPTTPGLAKAQCVEVASGARLGLEFTGTNEVYGLRLGGIACSGVLSAETHPDYLFGPGALFVRPKGTAVILR